MLSSVRILNLRLAKVGNMFLSMKVLELAQDPPNEFWMHERFLGNDMPDQGRLCWPTLVRFRC